MLANSNAAGKMRWQFVRERHDKWVWSRFRMDGTLDGASSGDFCDYAFAVSDAINHGFRPKSDYWTIVTETGATHYRSGESPAFVPSKGGDPFPPAARARDEDEAGPKEMTLEAERKREP